MLLKTVIMTYGAEKIFVVCILLISAFSFLQKHTPCWEILLVSHAFFHLSITTSSIMSVLEMERNLTGVPQQLTMRKMKSGGFAQMLVRCCLSSLPPLQEFVSNTRTQSGFGLLPFC